MPKKNVATHSKGKPDTAHANVGQEKTHVLVNPATGATMLVTQERWRNRKTDRDLDGWERQDAAEDEDE